MLTKKEARSYAYDLVIDKKTCITKLNDDEKENLAALIIESNNKFEAVEFTRDADIHDELPYKLAKYMKSRDPSDGQEILEFMIENAIRYAGNEMVDLLVEQEEEYEFNCKYDGA